MKVIVLLGLLATALSVDAQSNANVKTDTEWPQNDESNGGFLASFAYADIGNGSCTFGLPTPAVLFHVLNGHIVPGDDTNPVEGRYKVASPGSWEMENGTLRVLVYCQRDNLFNATDIEFTCDPEDVAELSVYSFPQNDEIAEASSNVHYRPGFRRGDVLTITLPAPVERFNITGGDSRWNIDYGLQSITVSGFISVAGEPGSDKTKEVAFSITYLKDEVDPRANWFSAGQISVAVTQEEAAEPDFY